MKPETVSIDWQLKELVQTEGRVSAESNRSSQLSLCSSIGSHTLPQSPYKDLSPVYSKEAEKKLTFQKHIGQNALTLRTPLMTSFHFGALPSISERSSPQIQKRNEKDIEGQQQIKYERISDGAQRVQGPGCNEISTQKHHQAVEDDLSHLELSEGQKGRINSESDQFNTMPSSRENEKKTLENVENQKLRVKKMFTCRDCS